MAEVDGAPPAEGTAAHYLHFLDWAEKKGEVPATTVQNWRNASVKVLEIEDDWPNMSVIQVDLDAHIGRFETLKRTAYTAGSMGAYKSRTKSGIEAYRKWLISPGSSDWKPKVGGTRAVKNDDGKTTKKVNGTVTTNATPPAPFGGHVPNRSTIIEYPFPLRPGTRVVLFLPEDLTDKEAKRIARFVESLALTEQLAITGQIDQ